MKQKHMEDGVYFRQRFGISLDDKLSKIVTRVNSISSKDFEY